jgi:hypothetical protein
MGFTTKCRASRMETPTHGWNLRTVDVNGTPTPYAGNLLVVLDKNLQVVWPNIEAGGPAIPM